MYLPPNKPQQLAITTTLSPRGRRLRLAEPPFPATTPYLYHQDDQLPHHLYRRPLLAEMAQTGVALEALIRHVVIHEVGHHFGLSDADMHAIEDSVED